MSASLLEQLQALHKNGPQSMRHGICTQVSRLTALEDGRMTHLMAMWPEGTGDARYPVPADRSNNDVGAAQIAYMKASTTIMWSRSIEYGQLRWELLEWLIEELQK